MFNNENVARYETARVAAGWSTDGRGLKLPKQKVHPLLLAKTISQRHSHIDLLLEANST